MRPVVVVWRSLWLPPSETFVMDHVTHLRRWRPVTLGLYRQASTLPIVPDRAPFARTPVGKKLSRGSLRLGHPLLYSGVMRANRPALMHAHFGTDTVDALPLARRHRLPLVVTFHGYDVNQAPRDDRRYQRRLPEIFVYASRLLAVSEVVAEKLVALGAPPQKVEVRYLGIDVTTPAPDPLLPRRGVLFVGRLVPVKGVADLLRAYAGLPGELRARQPLTVAGDGPDRARLEDLARDLGLSVRFLGVRSRVQVAELFAAARLFVAPSKRTAEGDEEAFGLTMLEAARAGLPVVGYAHAGALEAVADAETGLLAPLGDVAGLRSRIERLLSDDALSCRLGRQGRARVVGSFDVVRQTALLEDLYDELVALRRSLGSDGRA